MKTGLIDVDGHHFPNPALMKLAAYHRQNGDTVEWVNHLERYDKVYQSKVFTFTPDASTVIQADETVKGGTGYKMYEKLFCDDTEPDYSMYPKFEHAYGFLTRGCVRHCPWCAVTLQSPLADDKVSIDLRPDIINQKERFGDRELRSNRRSQIDTVVGHENKGAIPTATERTAGFLVMKKLPKGKNAKTLAKELFFLLPPYKQCVHSITSDNGSEFYGINVLLNILTQTVFFLLIPVRRGKED